MCMCCYIPHKLVLEPTPPTSFKSIFISILSKNWPKRRFWRIWRVRHNTFWKYLLKSKFLKGTKFLLFDATSNLFKEVKWSDHFSTQTELRVDGTTLEMPYVIFFDHCVEGGMEFKGRAFPPPPNTHTHFHSFSDHYRDWGG